jgi:hypothetical protein
VIASGLALLLLSVFASQLLAFWQSWHHYTQAGRQRQWTVTSFEYLDRDIRGAQRVVLTTTEIRIIHPKEVYTYRVSSENSFYRTPGNHHHFSLAIVESVRWWWEEELLWVELIYPEERYKTCYYITPDKR